jgi:hypothetical protein
MSGYYLRRALPVARCQPNPSSPGVLCAADRGRPPVWGGTVLAVSLRPGHWMDTHWLHLCMDHNGAFVVIRSHLVRALPCRSLRALNPAWGS